MNKTQCPHCFTVYLISDEQLKASQGMVRCGTCRERFEAQLMGANSVPKVDLSEAYIEPLSDSTQDTVHIDDLVDDSPNFSFKQASQPSAQIKSDNAADFNSEPSIEIEPTSAEKMDAEELQNLEKAIQQELKLPQPRPQPRSSDEPRREPVTNTSAKANFKNSHEEALIDQVDALIEKKILSASSAQTARNTIKRGKVEPTALEKRSRSQKSSRGANTDSEIEDALFQPRASKWSMFVRGLWSLVLLIILALLSGALIYQLWLKQLISWPDTPLVQDTVAPLIDVAKQTLDESDVAIPIRRNLSQLELVSARTEAHPVRPTTLLLRVSLINHAQITQPLPWLELSLTNADGRLVSRRNFSPRDYIYNNRIDETIGARQLKRITIELLAFPKQATGYEVKLLNK